MSTSIGDLKPSQTRQDLGIGSAAFCVILICWEHETGFLGYLHVSVSHSGEYMCIIY